MCLDVFDVLLRQDVWENGGGCFVLSALEAQQPKGEQEQREQEIQGGKLPLGNDSAAHGSDVRPDAASCRDDLSLPSNSRISMRRLQLDGRQCLRCSKRRTSPLENEHPQVRACA